jgi:hypothetical protein
MGALPRDADCEGNMPLGIQTLLLARLLLPELTCPREPPAKALAEDAVKFLADPAGVGEDDSFHHKIEGQALPELLIYP